MTQTYRIETLYTDGWQLIEEEAKNLTREQCDLMLNNYLSLGYNPKYLRAVRDS